jgi:lipopolysaccharide assembly outer membrane protein LptD (OstA)
MAPIRYEAQVIDNAVDGKQSVFTGKAKVTYQDMTLTAAKITVNWEKKELVAEGVFDSVWVKQKKGDSTQVRRLVGFPQFIQAGDTMAGESMTYNIVTKKGRVLRGRTRYEDGFYYGRALKLLEASTVNVADADFTTCDKPDNPHYRFRSQKMKIIINDKVIARPIIFYLGKFPVFALPFGLFPIKRGRHSGILIPRYGESSLEGRYLRDIGYYWAAGDYWDFRGAADFFEKSGFLFRGDLNYALRYKLRGSINGSWTRKNFEALGTKERRWDLNVNHSQELSPTAQLSVYGQLVSSGNFYREISTNREYRLQQEIRSNATLTKRFGTAWNVSVNLNQTRNLNTDDVTETLPQVYIRSGQTPIWPQPKTRRKGEVKEETRWYHSIYGSYYSQFLSRRSTTHTGYPLGSDAAKQEATGWDHSIQLSSSQKLFGWLNVNPAVNYRETWLDQRKTYSLDAGSNRIAGRLEKGFFARRTFDVSASFGTKVYGLFSPPLLKTVKLRHVATPNCSFSFQPDFSKDKFGYYQNVQDTSGTGASYDRYEGSLFGGTGTGSRKSLNFGLQNLFQMKVGDAEKAKKYDLFTWDFSSSYNWETNQYKWSDLYSSLRASPVSGVSADIATVYSFYQIDANGNRTPRTYFQDINRSRFQNLRLLRLVDFNANLGFQLRSRSKPRGKQTTTKQADQAPADQTLSGSVPGDRFDMNQPVSSIDIPWSLSATLSYSKNQANPFYPVKRFWMRTNSDIRVGKKWKLSYQAQWDLTTKKAVSQDFVFYRDLHCWEAQVVWTPTGYYKRLYFRINIKSAMLKDIKIEKGTGGGGLYGGY